MLCIARQISICILACCPRMSNYDGARRTAAHDGGAAGFGGGAQHDAEERPGAAAGARWSQLIFSSHACNCLVPPCSSVIGRSEEL
jgi:hypothetical protein